MRVRWTPTDVDFGTAGSGGRGWRSHTFADGVRLLTLTGPLDVGLAGELRRRISQLAGRGCRRLIVDARSLPAEGEQVVLLAGVFAGAPAGLSAVVVAPQGSPLADVLVHGVGVALSLDDAREQLASGRARAGRMVEPAASIASADRNALAVRQSLRWAQRSAREGDYERALGWLALVERIEGALTEPWSGQREQWQQAWRAQIAGEPRRRPRPGTRRSPG